jgi:HK97 family phage prohead protease
LVEQWQPYTREARVLGEEGDGRTIHLVAVPWDLPTEVWDSPTQRYVEEWQRGAFVKTIAEKRRRPFCYRHDLDDVIGKTVQLEEREDGLHEWLWMAHGRREDELLGKVRDQVVDGFSIRFEPVRPRGPHTQGEHVLRQEVRLIETSLTPRPQLASRVVEVRERPHLAVMTLVDVADVLAILRKDPAGT